MIVTFLYLWQSYWCPSLRLESGHVFIVNLVASINTIAHFAAFMLTLFCPLLNSTDPNVNWKYLTPKSPLMALLGKKKGHIKGKTAICDLGVIC